MHVSDDGAGMGREDALLCIERHATSKLRAEEDLHEIRSMGFRGEALPSIASVSRLTLTTALKGSPSGTRVTVEGGEIKDVRDAASSGTTVEVRDLFFNTPARRKFLKSPATELTHIIDTATRLALSHPAVGLSLTVDGQLTVELPRAASLAERLSQVYGGEFMDGLVELGCGDESLGCVAFVSRPDSLRDRRTHQFVFVNQRPVRDPSIAHAVYSGFEGMLPRDKHPVFFLFLSLHPRGVDFNVHPAKREVRFADKDAVYRMVARCVRGSFIPTEAAQDPHAVREPLAGFQAAAGMFASGPVTASIPFEALTSEPGREFMYLGEMFVAYVTEGGGLTIMDHHAAHERVLYERLLEGVSLENRRLLFPRQLRLSAQEYMVVLNHREVLAEMGLEVEDFGRDTVLVRGLPGFMEHADIRGILSEAASAMAEGERPGRSVREAVAMRMACHGSVRGSAVLGREALNALLRDLRACRQPEYCPHGRPTTISYTIDELKKLFKRK